MGSLGYRVKGARYAHRVFLLALGCLFCAGGYAQDQACKEIPAGQEFWIRLTDPVATYSSKRGATIQAVVIESPRCDGAPVFSSGTAMEGHITYVRRVGLGFWHDSSAVAIEFDKLFAGPSPLAVKARVEEVSNGREAVKRGVIEGVGGRDTPQMLMSTRLLHLPFWNTEAYWIFLIRRGAFPFSPEPETYLPAGTDLRLRLTASLELPADFLKPREEENTTEDVEIGNALREKLLTLPRRSLTGKGRPSDMVNLAFIGSRQQIEGAFKAAGWTYGDAVSAWSVLREARAMSSLNSYAHLPISRQWLAGKAPDFRLEQSFDSYQKREHIRFWNQDELAPNLWASSAIRETGASWSIHTGRFIHHVDGNIDAEREKVVRDLTLKGCVANVYRVQLGVNPEREKNASGDTFLSDGSVAVMELKDCEEPTTATVASSSAMAWRPRSKWKRFVRAQALSVHDVWRSNVIYASFDLSLTVIHALRERRIRDYEARQDTGVTLSPGAARIEGPKPEAFLPISSFPGQQSIY
jgi:hypothetical protein